MQVTRLPQAGITAPQIKTLNFQPQDTPPPDPPLDKTVLTGQVLGGLALGAGLGYAGMSLGAQMGMSYGAGALGGHPALQLLAIFAAGIPYAILGAAVGGSLGATAGIVGGAWAGGKIAENLKD